MPVRDKKTSSENPVVGGITITHPDKVLWPAVSGQPAITKLDLARYYDAAADHILPHITMRPITVVRAPDGISGGAFYQRHKLIGAAAPMNPIRAKGETEPFLALANKKGLLALAQAGALEIHPWGAKKCDPETAERIIFDLDPAPDVPFTRVIEAAKDLRKFLTDLGLIPFVKTTGGKGLHVVLPVKGVEWRRAKAFAKAVARAVQTAHPDAYTTTLAKKARHGKIFIDYLRNDRTATGIAPWSPRARAGAPIAMPLNWKELKSGLDPMRFTVANASKWLKRTDPWRHMAKSARALGPAEKALSAALK